MKRLTFTLILILSFVLCRAQYYKVNDPDNFVNVRTGPGINESIICTLPNDAIVFGVEYDQPNDNWLHVNFYLKKENSTIKSEYTPGIMTGFSLINGYVYKTRLTAIEELPKLKYQQNKNGFTCFNDSVKISVVFAAFKSVQHRLTFSKESEQVLEKIDGSPIIGTDGGMPKEIIKVISITINNRPVVIPNRYYKNLFNPSYNNYTYADKHGNIYLVMYNSDAAGTYSCIFVFKNGKFIQRLVFEGEC